MLRSQNPKVRAADLELVRARENQRQVKRSLLPLLELQAGYNKVLTSGMRLDPFTFAANVLVDVPGMLSFSMRKESAELLVIRAELLREAVWREQVTELYKAFHKNADLAEREKDLAAALENKPGDLPSALYSSLEQQREGAAKARAEWSEKIGAALGIPGVPVTASFESFPELGYGSAAKRPSPEAMAKLAMQISAVELVAMRAREYGAKLENLPQTSVSISTPRLYQNSAGQGLLWSSRDFAAGANVAWTADIRGQRSGRRRILQEEHALRREALAQEAARLGNRIRLALHALEESDGQLRQIEELLRSNPDSGMSHRLRVKKRELEEERREWQVALWFLDDPRWPGIPPLREKKRPVS